MKRVGLTILALTAAAMSQSFLLIDDFSTGSYNSGYQQVNTSAWTGAAGVPGGIRFTKFVINSNPDSEDARVRVVTSSGKFIYTTGSGMSTNGMLGYGFASGSDTMGTNALDLSLVATPFLALDFESNDTVGSIDTWLYSSTGSTLTMYTTPLPIVSSPTTLYINVGSFAQLGDVDSILHVFKPGIGGDFTLTKAYAVVPEPASIAMIGIGLAALKRRRK